MVKKAKNGFVAFLKRTLCCGRGGNNTKEYLKHLESLILEMSARVNEVESQLNNGQRMVAKKKTPKKDGNIVEAKTMKKDGNISESQTVDKKFLVYFAFNVHDLEKEGELYSKDVRTDDAHFYLTVYKREHLEVGLRLNSFPTTSFGKDFTIRLLGLKEDVSHTQKVQKYFKNDNIRCMSYDHFVDRENGFVKNGNAVFELDISGLDLKSTKTDGKASEFKPDTSILIDNHPMWINKAMLSSISPFFNNLLNVNVVGNNSEIAIGDVGMAEFVYFLDAAYKTQDDVSYKCITASNVESILRLAERFHAQDVLKRCEQFMKRYLPMEKNLVMALKYHMDDLLDACAKYYSSKAAFNKLEFSSEYKSLDASAMALLKEKINKKH